VRGAICRGAARAIDQGALTRFEPRRGEGGTKGARRRAMRGARVASERGERGSSLFEPSRVRRTMVGRDAPGRAGARNHADARRGVRAEGEGTRAKKRCVLCSLTFVSSALSFFGQIESDRYV
jgi:hypothetical protein